MSATKHTSSLARELTRVYETSGDLSIKVQKISVTWGELPGKTYQDFVRDFSQHQPAYRAWYHREYETLILPIWIDTSISSETTSTLNYIHIRVTSKRKSTKR